jgi:hypothetical protein
MQQTRRTVSWCLKCTTYTCRHRDCEEEHRFHMKERPANTEQYNKKGRWTSRIVMDKDRHESAECVGETERSLLILYGNKQYKVPKSVGITMIHEGEEWLTESQAMEEDYQDQPRTKQQQEDEERQKYEHKIHDIVRAQIEKEAKQKEEADRNGMINQRKKKK